MMAGTIAITGTTGFLGRHLVRRLASSGWNVRALIRPGRQFEAIDNVELIEGSLEQTESLERLIEGADAVVHGAGLIKAASRDQFFSVNERATGVFGQLCADSPTCTRFVLISSIAARAPEMSDYAASKRAGELRIEALTGGFNWSILRPPVVYGPGDQETLKLFKLMRYGVTFVPGSLDARVSMIYIDDLCSAVVSALGCAAIDGMTMEIHDGTENGYTWPDVADAAGRHFGRDVRSVVLPQALLWPVAFANVGIGRLFGTAPMLTPGKLREMFHPDWSCASNPLSEMTNWKPTVTILEGFKRSCIWYQQEGWL